MKQKLFNSVISSKVYRSHVALVLLISLFSPFSSFAQQSCDRACLEGYMSLYLGALVQRNPEVLPLSEDYKFTENGVKIPVGEGLWFGITELAGYRYDYIDTVSSQVASHITFKENGRYGLASIRLRVVDNKIIEIETVIDRALSNATEMVQPELLWGEIEEVETRLSREELQAATESYLLAVAEDDGSLAPFSEETCVRLENGRIMAMTENDTAFAPTPQHSQTNEWLNVVRSTFGMGCSRQISTGIYSFINSYDNARFPIVDVERQIVFGQWNFRRTGSVTSFEYEGRTIEHMASTQFPNENLLGQAFKFRDGKIIRVQGVFLNANVYRSGTGWE